MAHPPRLVTSPADAQESRARLPVLLNHRPSCRHRPGAGQSIILPTRSRLRHPLRERTEAGLVQSVDPLMQADGPAADTGLLAIVRWAAIARRATRQARPASWILEDANAAGRRPA